MDYNEKMFDELRKVNVSRETNAVIERDGLAVKITIAGVCHNFTTAKLAKIYIENYKASDNVIIDRIESGVVSQKTDEVKPKRRGRPKKADNDRTASV